MDLDTEIFKFVDKLRIRMPSKENHVKNQLLLKGHESVINLGKIDNLKITQFNEADGSTTRKIVSIDEKMISLSEADFSEFKALILTLLEKRPFDNLCTVDFLIDRSFDWLINVYKDKKAEINLTNHLLDCIEKETVTHHFYYKIESLAIEKEIRIGNVDIMFFTENRILEMYAEFIKEKPETSLEEFKKIYRGFSRINAHIKVNGIADRAEEIAKREIELAVDILKCYCLQHALEPKVLIFDLDYRIKKEGSATFINLPEGKIRESTIQIRNLAGVIPVELNAEDIDRFIKKGLILMSQFVLKKVRSDLYHVIVSLISQLSDITSTSNTYDKIVKAISLCESILLPRTGPGKSKGITRIKKALPKIIPDKDDREIIENNLVYFYKIRDQYLHNGIRLPINMESAFFFLDFQRVLILKMIELNKTITSIEEVLDYFEIK